MSTITTEGGDDLTTEGGGDLLTSGYATIDLGEGIGGLDDDWLFSLGESFLSAAQSCGFECDRIYVADGSFVEPCCDPCQLVARVEPGWRKPRANNPHICLPLLDAYVTLYLDLCVTVPPSNRAADPVEVNTQAQANLSKRWQIMRGLQYGHGSGELGPFGSRVTPGEWTAVWTEGGCARWQTRWTVTV